MIKKGELFMSWYKIILSVEQVSNGKHKKIQDEFGDIFMRAGGPKGVALFSSNFLPGDTLEIYFSPEASQLSKHLIDAYSGVPCDVPTRKDAGLLVGHDSAKEDLLRKE